MNPTVFHRDGLVPPGPPNVDGLLPTLVTAGVEAADALLATGPGQVTVRRVAARLTANAVAPAVTCRPGSSPVAAPRTAAARCWPHRAARTTRPARRW